MVCLQNRLFILVVLFLFDAVQSKKICDLKNIKCVTNAGKNNFKRIISGNSGLMPPLETLHEDRIVVNMTNLEYVLTNTTLYGVKNCEVKLMSMNAEQLDYIYVWECPRFILNTNFVAKGTIGNINIDHDGSLELVADHYVVIFKGPYGKFLDEKDKKLRVYVNVSDIDTQPKKKISFTCVLHKGDETIGDSLKAHFDDNWQNMEKSLRNPTIHILLLHFVEAVNIFLKAVPVDESLADLE